MRIAIQIGIDEKGDISVTYPRDIVVALGLLERAKAIINATVDAPKEAKPKLDVVGAMPNLKGN